VSVIYSYRRNYRKSPDLRPEPAVLVADTQIVEVVGQGIERAGGRRGSLWPVVGAIGLLVGCRW